MKDDYVYIYLVSRRKSFDYDVPKSWEEVNFQRGDWLDCAIFRKLKTSIDKDDDEWIESHGVQPSDWNSECVITEVKSEP